MGATPHFDAFRRALDAALSVRGSVRLLDRRTPEAARRDPKYREQLQDPLADWLAGLELEHNHLLYEAEPSLTPWTRRCLRQADLLLLVCDASSPLRPELEREVGRLAESALAPRLELVLLSASGDASAPSAALRARFPGHPHHFVRVDVLADAERLARLLTGHGVGLVFSGGGARGFAHLGVLKALEQARVPIDLVGGTSIGGALAALHARGLTAAELLAAARDAFLLRGPPIDYTVPVVALASGRRIHERLRAVFGDMDIEDLRLPFFCVSSNLTRCSIMVHDRGKLWQALRASLSIPAVLPPMRIGDELFADGGLVNAMPVDVMRERTSDSGRVIAVDAMFESDLDASAFSESGIFDGGQHVVQRALGRAPAVPGLVKLLLEMYAMGETHYTNARRQHADVILRPDVGRISILAWDRFDVAVEAGYRATMEQLERGKGSLWEGP